MASRSLAATYRRYGEVDAAPSPLYQRIATAISESPPALQAIGTAPPRRRQPASILAALHHLALAGRAPALASAYGEADPEAAAVAAIGTLINDRDAVASLVRQRGVSAPETVRGAVLHPAVAAAASTAKADAVGLIDVGAIAGFNLQVDRVGIRYDNGQVLGDQTSTVQVTARVVGDLEIPTRVMPPVSARINLGSEVLDVNDEEEVRWLRACVAPDANERRVRLDAELGLARDAPPQLVVGNVADRITDAVALVPSDALPVVLTTWTLSRLGPEARQVFVRNLQTDRPVAMVSVEGVGVTPGIPTLGDRPASGHSIIGMAIVEGGRSTATALGRCWSRGAVLSWLEGQQP